MERSGEPEARRVSGTLVMALFAAVTLSAALAIVLVARSGMIGLTLDRTGEAPITVLREELVRAYDNTAGEYASAYTVQYRYTADGRAYERELELSRGYDPDETYKVCYEPGNPENYRLARAGQDCGAATFFR